MASELNELRAGPATGAVSFADRLAEAGGRRGAARAAGLLGVVDGKRGDVGSTARAYASAYLEEREGRSPVADALTVNPYLGQDSLEPFLAACRRAGTGLFCLVKTSNSGSADIQDAAASDGRAPRPPGPA